MAAGGATAQGSSPLGSSPQAASLDPSAYPTWRVKFHPPLEIASENGIFRDSTWFLEWRIVMQVRAARAHMHMRNMRTCAYMPHAEGVNGYL